MTRTARCLWALLAGLVLLGPVPLAAQAPGPREVIRETVDAVLAVLREPGLDSEERRRRIEEIAYARFQFETMSRLVLARAWRRFTPEQREEFMREFRELLSKSYGRRIDRYEQEEVEIRDVRKEVRGDVTVRTVVVGGQADGVGIDYRLRERNGVWSVIDVTVEGVSLVSTYREQFSEVLGQGGPEELLRRLRQKNAQNDPAETSGAGG